MTRTTGLGPTGAPAVRPIIIRTATACRTPMMSLRTLTTGFVLLALLAAPAGTHGQTAPGAIPPATLPPTIPIFPLEDVMLFPGASRPLHIFEPRYRAMVADALDGDRIIGMVMLQPGYEDDYAGRPAVYDIGCAGVIANVERLADGRYNIVLRGLVKFRIAAEERDTTQPYRIARVEALPEPVDDDDRDALRAHRPLMLELLTFVTSGPPPTPDELPDELLVNGLAQFLGMDAHDRLDLLEQAGPLARADTLVEMLDRGALSR